MHVGSLFIGLLVLNSVGSSLAGLVYMYYMDFALLFEIADSGHNLHKLCMAIYEHFTPEPVPHGISKSEKLFFATLPSTMSRVKE